MCGIAAVLYSSSINLDPSILTALKQAIEPRGPDWNSHVELQVAESATKLKLFASVLALRGANIVQQPYCKNNIDCTQLDQDFLLFNGEIYCDTYTNEELLQAQSDTEIVAEKLFSAQSVDEIQVSLAALRGPYSFILVKHALNLIVFGRDPLGRRSLLIRFPDTCHAKGPLMISSVATAPFTDWEPVGTNGIYSISTCLSSDTIAHHTSPRTDAQKPLTLHVGAFPEFQQSIDLVKQFASIHGYERELAPALGLLTVLDQSIARRVRTIPATSLALGNSLSVKPIANGARLGVLFSGGLDCTVLAALAHRHISNMDEPIDLINVCFAAPSHLSPDRKTAIASFKELCNLFPTRKWNLVCVNVTSDEVHLNEKHILDLIHPKVAHMDFNIGGALWFAARGKGYLGTLHKIEIQQNGDNQHHLELLLKPFGQPTDQDAIATSLPHKRQATNDVRDTKKARSVKQVVPQHQYQLSYSDSLYVSNAKVLLNGIGADELFAGYTRHRVAFGRGGAEGLQNELDLDVSRLWERNLGRDDRCIADHGRELRQPFLDEDVIKFASSLPLSDKAELRIQRGTGEKKILRLVAHLLGLAQCAQLDKRAIQFGSRIAKLSNAKVTKGKVGGTNEYERSTE